MNITMTLTDVQSEILTAIAKERGTTLGDLLKNESAMNLIRNRVAQASNELIYSDNYPTEVVNKIIGTTTSTTAS